MKIRKEKFNFPLRIINLLKGAVVCALFFSLIYVNVKRPRILVLHSYAEDFSWVADFNTSFRNKFKHSSNPVVYYSYMNTLNKQTARYKARAGTEALQMIKTINPNIILSIFTDANEFAVQKYLNNPKVQIIYNLKSDPSKFQYDTGTNTQGIKGAPALKDLNDLLLLANPKRPLRIAHMGDQSTSVRLYDTYITSYPWKDIVLEDSILLDNLPQWKRAVELLSEKVDYIVVSKYFSVAERVDGGPILATKNFMKWLMSASKVPIVGLYSSTVEEGGDLAVEDSPFEQGEKMAQMAISILDGKPVVPKMQPVEHFVELRSDNCRLILPEVYSSFSTALRQHRK